MFGLFKKKDKEKPAQARPEGESQAYRQFAAAFPGEETDILAVTGPARPASAPVEGTGLFRVAMVLTAWKDEYTGQLRREEGRLEAMVDARVLEYLRQHMTGNGLISATVRPSEDGRRFMLTDLPRPGFDPELKELLEKQKQPVTVEAGELGTFTLNAAMGLFQGEVDWLGRTVQLSFDREEDPEECARAAQALFNCAGDWERRARELAARKLLEQAEQWEGQDGGEPLPTERELAGRLETEDIQVAAAGGVELWLRDRELLWPQSVQVSGTLTGGPTAAAAEE